ncbi:MAG: DUF1583 domain-containing protein [Planctomycetaceae bacterium]
MVTQLQMSLAFACAFSVSGALAADSAESGAVAKIIGDRILAENVHAIRSRAAQLSSDERFQYLLKVVFVDSPVGTMRVVGDFSQTDPVPVTVTSADDRELSGERYSGGKVVSPVFDLLDAAAELGRLTELLERLQQLPQVTDEFQLKARAALRLLACLELQDHKAADAAADEVLLLVQQSKPKSIADMWPETLAIERAVRRHQADQLVNDVASVLYTKRSWEVPPAGFMVWRAHLAAVTHLSSVRNADVEVRPLGAVSDVRPWQAVEQRSGGSQGNGYPQATWVSSNGEVQHLSGHGMDYLLYGSPLRGSYEVEADLCVAGDPQFLVAGRILGMAEGRHAMRIGTFREGISLQAVEPHWGPHNVWSRYRAVVRNGTLTVSIDGRKAFTEPLTEHHDPWVGIHCSPQRYARIRDIRITGSPDVPAEVLLSADPALRSWASYHEEAFNVVGGSWFSEHDEQNNGQIVAHPNPALVGMFAESLLQYQRPLFEDGSVSYEFYYQPGQTVAFPAIDRLAFLLQPNGVSMHWVTDGKYDRSSIGPDNSFDEPACLRGPPSIPLLADGWNSMKISVTGSTVALELNDTLIFERELETSNRRIFGFFRYADSELRVRNVRMAADWPLSVPSAADQIFADQKVLQLDAKLPDLHDVFHHDFATDGLPRKHFRIPPGQPAPGVSASGLLHAERGNGVGWVYSLFHPTVEMHGDFDVTLHFDDLQVPSENSGCGIGLFLGDKHMELLRRHGGPLVERVLATYTTPSPGGERRMFGFDITTEALSGTFRIVRRGDTVFALFADHDSTSFRVVAEHTWENCGLLPATLDIRVNTHKEGRVQVAWKHFDVAAERLMRLPESDRSKPVVFTINTDGSNLKQLTQPMPEFVWHGSPKWSPDGRLIAYDAWTGNARTSHVYVMDADGGNQTDLGVGFIPTFSPDSRQLAFTWAGHGLTVMNVDGTDRKVITTDGWGCEWSPDGRWLAYGSSGRQANGKSGANLILVDINTGEKRELLREELAEQFTGIQWNMAWSPDSRQIIFKGDHRNGAQIAIVSAEGSDTEFRIVTDENLSGNFSWHSDGSRILLTRSGRLFEYQLASKQIDLLPGHPAEPAKSGGFWDRSGQRIVFIGTAKAGSVPWTP